MNTRQVYCVVCGIRMTDSLSLKTSERHRNVGSLPSTPNCSLGRTENRAVLGQHGQTWALLQPRLLRFVFWFHHSAASQRANKLFQSNIEWRLGCEPRLRCHPHFSSPQALRGNEFCHRSPSLPPLFNHSSSHYFRLPAYFLLFCHTRFNSPYTCWLSSSSPAPQSKC